MSRQKKKTDDMQRENYFTKMIEKARTLCGSTNRSAAGNMVFSSPSMSGARVFFWSSNAAGSRFTAISRETERRD